MRVHPLVLVAVLLGVAGCGLLPTNPPPTDGLGNEIYELAGQRFRIEAVATGLEVPWSLAFLPDGRLVVTERPGRLRVLDVADGATLLVQRIEDVAPQLPRSEVGLMGLAISPSFDTDGLVYVSYTTPDGPGFRNVVARFRLGPRGFEPADATPLIANLPAAYVHDGFPLRFGPDGMLYASTGEATQSQRAQDLTYLGGKFLRYNADGTIPADNPFPGSPVWSLGHRNPQGFAFHPTRPELLLATEHGSSFPLDGTGGEDELNRIRPGRNYGWPLYRRDQTAPGFEPPLWHSGDEAIAPAGATFCTGDRYPAWQNAFLFVGLRGASLWVVHLTTDGSDQVAGIARGLRDKLGRLRAIAEGPDGYLYIATSNRDGRGTPGPEDDRVLRLVPVE